MAAGLVVPVSGPYLGLFGGNALGTQDDNGYELACTIQGQEINRSDVYGETLVEGIYRGQNWKCRFRGLEWNKVGLLNSFQVFGQQGGSGSFSPVLQNVGDRMSRYAQTMLLTAILGNPPSTPQTVTALTAIISPNSQAAFMMTSKMREMPIEFSLLPYSTVISSTTFNVPFTTT